MKKSKWIKPELIVVVQGSPEEAVLFGCKSAVVKGPSISFCEVNRMMQCATPANS